MRGKQHISEASHPQAAREGRRPRACRLAALLLCCCALPGCLERTVTITSMPPGAIVWLNDTEVGRTPVTTAFTYYGDYDVRLRKEGYEPLSTHHKARTPVYEYAPIDLVATAVPARIKTNLEWHFDLMPLPEAKAGEDALIQRARDMQTQSGAPR